MKQEETPDVKEEVKDEVEPDSSIQLQEETPKNSIPVDEKEEASSGWALPEKEGDSKKPSEPNQWNDTPPRQPFYVPTTQREQIQRSPEIPSLPVFPQQPPQHFVQRQQEQITPQPQQQ